jgi:hypothetical protein
MRKIRWAIPISALALLSAGTSLNAKQAKGDEAVRPEQVTKLLAKVKVEASQLKDDFETLQSFTACSVSWESHVTMLNQVREDINVIGRDEQKLEEYRSDAASWQQAAIDQIRPALAELAANTEAIIERVNKVPKVLTAPEYKDYVEANAAAAAHLVKMISEGLEYGRSK